MDTLQKMRDRLNGIDDLELLEVAKDLLSDMADVQRLKEQIEMREAGFTEGKRAAFWFFANGLNPEELAHATNTAIGRIRFLKEKQEREDFKKTLTATPAEEPEKPQPKTPHSGSFGGLGESFGTSSKKFGGV